ELGRSCARDRTGPPRLTRSGCAAPAAVEDESGDGVGNGVESSDEPGEGAPALVLLLARERDLADDAPLAFDPAPLDRAVLDGRGRDAVAVRVLPALRREGAVGDLDRDLEARHPTMVVPRQGLVQFQSSRLISPLPTDSFAGEGVAVSFVEHEKPVRVAETGKVPGVTVIAYRPR